MEKDPKQRRREHAWLPTGVGLLEDEWRSRHRALQSMVAACAVALVIWGLAKGLGVLHIAGDVVPIALLGLVSSVRRLNPRVRSLMCALALFAVCAATVHFAGGRPEAHFTFFVAIVLVALYEDWAVFGVATLFVFVQHVVMGTMGAESTFGHSGPPLLWASVHSVGIAFCGMAAVCWWHSNEAVRRRAALAQRRARQQESVAAMGRLALRSSDVAELQSRFVTTVRDVLDVPIAALLCLDADGSLSPAAIVGQDDVPPIPGGSRRSHSALAVERGEPVVVADRDREDRFDTSTMTSLGLRAGISVPVYDGHAVRGTLTAHSREPRAFDEHDVHFLDSMGHLLGGVMERDNMERRLRHASQHDQLTGLPNRGTLMVHLRDALGITQAQGGVVAVIYADVDRFKEVNDTLGHAAGDELLRAIAQRLRGVLRAGDVAGRLGGDEFVIVAGPLADEAAADAVVARIAQAFAAPFRLAGGATSATVSVGLATGAAVAQAEHLLQDADAAMYRAKRERQSLRQTG